MNYLLAFRDCAFFDDKLFFVTEEPDKWPLCLDLKNFIIFPWKITNPDTFPSVLVDRIISNEECIIGIDDSINHIIKYNFDNKTIRDIETGIKSKTGISYVKIFKNKLYIFGKKEGIYIIDIETGKLNFEKYPNEFETCYAAYDYSGKIVQIIPKNGNAILKYNFESNKFQICNTDRCIVEATFVTAEKDGVYIVEETKRLLLYNGITLDVMFDLDQHSAINADISRVCITESYYIFLPFHKEKIIIVNRKNNEIRVEKQYPPDFMYENKGWGKYYGFATDGEHLYYAPRISNYLLRISKTTGEMKWFSTEIKDEQLLLIDMIKQPIIYENNDIGLQRYINMLVKYY